MNAHQKAHLLFFVGDREPVFHHHDPGPHQHAFKFGNVAEELFDLVFGGKAHDAFDPGPVVPGPVEQHDFPACRKMRDIALKVPLRAFAV